MKMISKKMLLSLSVVAATLIVVGGCNSSGGDTVTGDDSLPAWTSSLLDINVTSAAQAISDYRFATEFVSDLSFTKLAPALQEEQTVASTVDTLEQTIKEKFIGSHQSGAQRSPSKIAQAPADGTYQCGISGDFVITTEDGAWGENGSYRRWTEEFHNCVDDGNGDLGASKCVIEDMEGNVTITGRCEEFSYEDDSYYEEEGLSYTNYLETWIADDASTYIIRVNLAGNMKDDYTQVDGMEDGVYTNAILGGFNIQGRENAGSLAESSVTYEFKTYQRTENYHYNMEAGHFTTNEMIDDGYVGVSIVDINASGGEENNVGVGIYFVNTAAVDVYVDENVTNFTLNGKFGTACLEGMVDFTTVETIVNDDALEDACSGEKMPRDGKVRISGNGEAMGVFSLVSDHGELTITAGEEEEVFECWNDLPKCSDINF